jgi:hypothetical protein
LDAGFTNHCFVAQRLISLTINWVQLWSSYPPPHLSQKFLFKTVQTWQSKHITCVDAERGY